MKWLCGRRHYFGPEDEYAQPMGRMLTATVEDATLVAHKGGDPVGGKNSLAVQVLWQSRGRPGGAVKTPPFPDLIKKFCCLPE